MQKKNKKTSKNKLDALIKNRKMVLSVVLIIVVLLVSLMFLATYFRDFGKTYVSTNKKDIFTLVDLKVNNLKYGDKESTVKKTLGQPNKSKEDVKGVYKYKVLEYKGLTLTLKEFYDDYILVKAEITSHKYKTSRKIRVGNKITKAYRKYKVENNKGAYLYGNYSNKALKDSENKANIYFGIRSSKNLLYVNRDSVINGLTTNIAKLDIEYHHGKIKKITWSYDFE